MFADVTARRRKNMQAVKGKDTKPEKAVRSLLHCAGYRFRLHSIDLPGRPDIVFPGRRKVIEVRGCFWHRHPDPFCPNAVAPQTRADWWRTKLEGNVSRDQRNLVALNAAGWSVLILWECEIKKCNLLERVTEFLGPART